ncbi:MAG: sigma-54 dependent transcriptional regulator [Acidobacteriia bacterium]|nr:sigma-54 dependent transcriptional regulator [Terriglobia bacterium]
MTHSVNKDASAVTAGQGSILVVDDEGRQREILQAILEDEGYAVTTAVSGEQALRVMKNSRFDLVLTDLKMPGISGIKLLEEISSADPTITVILITAHGSIESAVEATKKGVFKYLTKPFDKAELLTVVTEVFDKLQRLKKMLIGDSPRMRDVLKMIAKVAHTNSTVLLCGESGTGKELIARMIHSNSPRSEFPFYAINCAALPDTLLESELFGFEKGSHSQALQRKLGLFEMADRSTLFLDEIGDMSLMMQAKLLRALQEREIVRIGGAQPVKVNVRIIAATNQDLAQLMKDGRFREDLYYRINVITIVAPPLRDRKNDIDSLVDHFLKKHAAAVRRTVVRVSDEAREFIHDYSWPGNVRQLESAIERAVLLGEGDQIELEDLPIEIRRPSFMTSQKTTLIPEGGMSLEEHEKQLLLEALTRSNGSITKAAQLLGISFRTMQYRLEKFGISRRDVLIQTPKSRS